MFSAIHGCPLLQWVFSAVLVDFRVFSLALVGFLGLAATFGSGLGGSGVAGVVEAVGATSFCTAAFSSSAFCFVRSFSVRALVLGFGLGFSGGANKGFS